ncbi:MAG: DHH family phosphoesterase [Planctomycetes bacterium]|nr:DHH family phosphoesterase [Planctomycetota bacterium]
MKKTWLLDTKQKCTAFLKHIRKAKRIVVSTHNNPDPDSIASACGLNYLIQKCAGKSSVVIYGGLVGRAENQAMIRKLGLEILPSVMIDFSAFDMAVLADTRFASGFHPLPPGFSNFCEFDHHLEVKEGTEGAFTDIRTHYGATSTIVSEYLRQQRVKLPTTLATALFYGIKTDTANLSRMGGQWDLDSYMYMFERADKKLLMEIEKPLLPPSYFGDLRSCIDTAKLYGSAVILELGSVSQIEIVAEVADLFLRIPQVEWVLSSGYRGEEMAVSMRALREGSRAGALVKRMLDGRGLGGGHDLLAGGRIALNGNSGPEKAYGAQAEYIRKQFLSHLEMNDAEASPLLKVQTKNGS